MWLWMISKTDGLQSHLLIRCLTLSHHHFLITKASLYLFFFSDTVNQHRATSYQKLNVSFLNCKVVQEKSIL